MSESVHDEQQIWGYERGRKNNEEKTQNKVNINVNVKKMKKALKKRRPPHP
jgi:hypothetical protein